MPTYTLSIEDRLAFTRMTKHTGADCWKEICKDGVRLRQPTPQEYEKMRRALLFARLLECLASPRPWERLKNFWERDEGVWWPLYFTINRRHKLLKYSPFTYLVNYCFRCHPKDKKLVNDIKALRVRARSGIHQAHIEENCNISQVRPCAQLTIGYAYKRVGFVSGEVDLDTFKRVLREHGLEGEEMNWQLMKPRKVDKFKDLH